MLSVNLSVNSADSFVARLVRPLLLAAFLATALFGASGFIATRGAEAASPGYCWVYEAGIPTKVSGPAVRSSGTALCDRRMYWLEVHVEIWMIKNGVYSRVADDWEGFWAKVTATYPITTSGCSGTASYYTRVKVKWLEDWGYNTGETGWRYSSSRSITC